MAQAPPILIYEPGGGVSSPIGSNPPVYTQAGITVLIEGQDYVDVVFGSIQTDDEWVLGECVVVNETDGDPLNLWPGIITEKTEAGFRVYLNGLPDSGNYYLHWAVSGINIEPSEAMTYLLSGPSSITSGEAATYYVSLPPSTYVNSPVTVTPAEGGLEIGVFSPEFVTLTTDSPSTSFTFTPGIYGETTITVNNDSGLTDPVDLALTVVLPTYTLIGPSSGVSGVASTDFTVELTGSVVGTVTVTPSDGGGGGTFTPTTVALTTVAPSDTFTYTPASAGTKTISATNDGGLTNPGNLTYTATAPPLTQHLLDTLTSYWALDETSTGSIAVQRNDSHGTNHLDDIVHTSSGTGKINNGVLLVAASAQYLGPNTDTSLQVTGSFTFSCWVKLTTQGSVAGTVVLSKDNVSGTREYALEYADGTNFGFRFYVNAYGAYSTITPAISNGVWTHVVAWYDSGTSKVSLRINDTTTYVGTNTSALITGSAGFAIGARQYGPSPGYLDGVVDEVGFWERLLTADEISFLYNGGSGNPYSSFDA